MGSEEDTPQDEKLLEWLHQILPANDRTDYEHELLTYWLDGYRLEVREGKKKPFESPFHPFSKNEIELITRHSFKYVEKEIPIEGIVGHLRIGMGRILDKPILNRARYINPWGENYLSDQYMERRIQVDMCFNETAGISPRFKLDLPEAKFTPFYAFVVNWDDVVKDTIDATQMIFEKDKDVSDDVIIYFPEDPVKISSLQITPYGPLISLPTVIRPVRK